MKYYKVLVASPRYHGDEALTYKSELKLAAGRIVAVELQQRIVVAVVTSEVPKPTFKTKDISKILTEEALPGQLLDLVRWFKDYYPAPLGSLAQMILPSSLLQASRGSRTTADEQTVVALPDMTLEQKQAVRAVNGSSGQTVLLHGDTGTGKTRVYQELSNEQLDRGKSVLILTPEIGLTSQLQRGFESTFPGRVAVVHSNLTPAQRRNQWLRILRSTEPLIIIGPRSALFAPVRQLGQIIIDEAHDQAYKQEQQPYYQTTRVAAALAKLHSAGLLLGTATPLVADYYTFESKKLPIIRMREPAIRHNHEIAIEVVELKDRNLFTRSQHLSGPLIDAINTTLQVKKQSLIFLNRRGTARVVLCENCGWHALCPRCDLALTYHGDSHTIRCHVCNYQSSAPSKCPSCGHTEIAYKSIGTKTIVSELERLFPQARIRRFDTDLKKNERLEELYEEIATSDSIDILVGTQMLAKGLDLPNLELVGIVAADTSLYIPDYSAEEQSYQLLTQIMGRVGRGHGAGRIVIQSYNPEHFTLQAAIGREYKVFYEHQIAEREKFLYPPFVYLLKLRISRASSKASAAAAESLRNNILEQNLPIEIIGPSPSFHEKSNDKYNWQLVIKSRQRPVLTKIIKTLPANILHDIDPTGLL